MSENLKYSDVKRKNSDFSFVNKVAEFGINHQWTKGFHEMLEDKDANLAYFWTTLSAVGNELAEEVTENVTNYIDNVSNIDTCKIKALQSICKEYGINFDILNFSDTPLEVMKLMDIVSMNKTFLLDENYSRVMPLTRLSIEDYSAYQFDYYNEEFFDSDYVNGDIRISLSAASMYMNEMNQFTSYFLLKDQDPDDYETRLAAYRNRPDWNELSDDQELSSYRLQEGYHKLFVDRERLKTFPTWLSDYSNDFITLDDEIEEVSGYYRTYINDRLTMSETKIAYPRNVLEVLKEAEDTYEFVGHLSTVIEREDEYSDQLRFNKIFKGKKTGNNLYYVEFTPSREQTLIDFRKYTYNDQFYFWIITDPTDSRIIASSNSRIDSTSDRCTLYAPVYIEDETYAYNGIRIAPDEFVDDVFLSSMVYFTNIKKVDGKWTYTLEQEKEVNLYKIGVVNVNTVFYPDRIVNRNLHTTVSEEDYHECLENIFYDLLNTMCNLEYLDPTMKEKRIYKNLGSEKLKLTSLMNLDKNNTQAIITAKNKNRVPLRFNEVEAVDNIDSGLSVLEDYSTAEQKIIELEVQRRVQTQNSLFNQTRYFYYREAKVKEYFKYIQQIYNDRYLVQNEIYEVDNDYFVVKNQEYQSMIDSDGDLDDIMVRNVSYILADMAVKISEIREKLKQTAQKYYMRGTSELLFFTINDYLLNNVKYNHDELSGYRGRFADLKLIEYVDNTEYFNIKQNLQEYANIKYENYTNNRYFENTMVEQLYLRSYNPKFDYKRSMSLGYDEISTYYTNAQSLDFNTDDELQDFLNTVYNTGATFSHIDTKTNDITHSAKMNQGVVWDKKEEAMDLLYKMYSGNEFGIDPLYNSKNKTHSSYQIHPFMYNFVEYMDQVFPIANYYTKYMPENYNALVAQNIDKYVGFFGEVRNIWLTDSFDFSGYSSKYEVETNIQETNNSFKSPYVDRDGMFIDEFINNVFDTKTTLYSPTCPDIVMKGEKFEYSTRILDYISHLKMSNYEQNLLEKRFKTYMSVIEDIVSRNPQYYDIYKYTTDINGNTIFLLKKYQNEVSEATQEEKRNTRGTLWVRIKNHPCAFPAFNIDLVEFATSGKLVHKVFETNNESNIVLSETNSLFFFDNQDKINSEIFTNFCGGFYDMELDSTRQYLMLTYTPSQIYNFSSVHSSKNVNVMVGKLTKRYDYENILFRYSFEKDDSGNEKIQNENLREKEVDYVYNEFVGFVRKADSIGAVFVQKHVNPDTKNDTLKENVVWKNNIIKVNNDFADYTVMYGVKVIMNTFGYDGSSVRKELDISDIKYNISPDNNICMSYSGDRITIAFESEEITQNSLVTNFSEFDYNDMINSREMLLSVYNDGHISDDVNLQEYYKHQLVAWPYVTTDHNIRDNITVNAQLINTFDAFDKYIIAIDIDSSTNKFSHLQTTYFNLNSDMSFMPLYSQESGSSRFWNNAQLSASSDEGINVEIMGYSGNWYEKEDEDQFYEGIDTLAQDQALKALENINDYAVGYEDPFPYTMEAFSDSEGYVSSYIPFDIYDQLSVGSLDETVSAYITKDDTHVWRTRIVKIDGSTETEISALIRFIRPSSNTDIGPLYFPLNNNMYNEYEKVEAIIHREYGVKFEDGSYDIYDGGTLISADVGDDYIFNRLATYKARAKAQTVTTNSLGQITIDGEEYDDLSVFFHKIPQGIPALQIQKTQDGYRMADDELTAGIPISESDVRRVIRPIPFKWTYSNGLSGEEEEFITEIVSLSGGCYFYDGTIGEDIFNKLQVGDKLTTQAVSVTNSGTEMGYSYRIVPNMTIDEPQLSDVMYLKDFTLGAFFITKEDDQYRMTSNLKYGERYPIYTLSSLFVNRDTSLLGYYTFIDSGKMMNLIPGYEYYYVDGYDKSVVNGIYLDKYGKYLVTDSSGFLRSKDGITWTKYELNQRLTKVLSGDGFDFIVQGYGNLLYSGDFDQIINYMSDELNVIRYEIPEDPQMFVIPLSGYQISAYSFGLYNVYNNATLMRYDNETKTFTNSYRYVGNFDEDYRYNDGQIGLSSYSINDIVAMSADFDDNGISVYFDYKDGLTEVNAATTYAFVKANTRNVLNYDKYHMMALNPVSSTDLKNKMADVKENTAVSAITVLNSKFPWLNPDLSFKYPSQHLIKNKNGFPDLE